MAHLFCLENDASVGIQTVNKTQFKGTLTKGATQHVREFLITSKRITINDYVVGADDAVASFILSPKIVYRLAEDVAFLGHDDTSVVLISSGKTWQSAPAQVSPGYGCSTATSRLFFTFSDPKISTVINL